MPLRIRPSGAIARAVEIDVAGSSYLACLGPCLTPVPGFGLAAGADDWIELVVNGVHAYAGDVELVPRATLLVGDAIASTRGGEPVLRFMAG